jgi:hypothetical protein
VERRDRVPALRLPDRRGQARRTPLAVAPARRRPGEPDMKRQRFRSAGGSSTPWLSMTR